MAHALDNKWNTSTPFEFAPVWTLVPFEFVSRQLAHKSFEVIQPNICFRRGIHHATHIQELCDFFGLLHSDIRVANVRLAAHENRPWHDSSLGFPSSPSGHILLRDFSSSQA